MSTSTPAIHPSKTRPVSGRSKYRYMESRYVDDFFSNGTLRLTTYDECRKHEDQSRRDSREGKANFYFPHANHAIAGIQGVGRQSYMLCTSSTLSDEILSRFQADAWIEIFDPQGFAEAMSHAILGFTQLQMAPCRYAIKRSIEQRTIQPILPDPTQLVLAAQSGIAGSVEAAFEAMNRQMGERLDALLGDQTYFIKEEYPFSVEDEFRFVWTVDHEVIAPTVFKCMEAANYCIPGHRERSK